MSEEPMAHGDVHRPVAQQSLAELIAEDARAALVFEAFGLHYCCGGSQTVEDAARDVGVPLAPLVGALSALRPLATSAEPDLASADPDVIARHLVDHHHAYVRQAAPVIHAWLDKLVTRHGTRHPELVDVRHRFSQLAAALTAQMAKEEAMLFPVIDEHCRARRSGLRPPPGPFGSLLDPIRALERDHLAAGDLMEHLHQITHGFTPPPDGCATFQLCYAELARFEHDLHQHIHLEANVLFPKTLDWENYL
jgi:regulator of cell morphogenesis and NO signaling